MTDLRHPFEPGYRPVFSGRLLALAASFENKPRRLFYGLLHRADYPETLPAAYQYLNERLAYIDKNYSARFLETCSLSDLEIQIFTERFIPVLSESTTYWHQSAPVLLTEPAWLYGIVQTATGQTPEAHALLEIGRHTVSFNSSYRGLLANIATDLPPITTQAFSENWRIPDHFFDLGVLQLAFAGFTRVFFPELLGFTLAYCSRPALTEVGAAMQATHWQQQLAMRQSLLASQLPALRAVINAYFGEFANRQALLWQRLQTGFWLYQQAAAACVHSLIEQSNAESSVRQAMIDLLQSKAKAAFGHHGKIVLGGKILDDWFAEIPFDSENFLNALRQSPYAASADRLLGLFDFSGPMFGVLNDNEKTLVKNWLERPDITAEPTQPPKTAPFFSFIAPSFPAKEIAYNRLNNRQLYYYLINADLFPEVSGAALKKADSILRLARRFPLPFKRYTHENFREYVSGIYQREVNAYRPLSGAPLLTKADYRWAILQFAPTILTDGCWLQKIGQNNAFDQVSSLLKRIYHDEIGAGKLEQNHPYIYRQLLTSLAIELPPHHTQAFVEYPDFIAGAFDIPVYLLSISLGAQALLPELLGLNLAIELSGLGRTYQRLSDSLRHWGINAKIIDLHITIDNIASGHAALAEQAIQQYLDDILSRQGEAEMQRHWRRIYTGYRSLHVCGGRFIVMLASHFLIKKLPALAGIYFDKFISKKTVDV